MNSKAKANCLVIVSSKSDKQDASPVATIG
jgi:hypothetical protein